MRVLLIILAVLIVVPSWSGDERLPLWDAVPTVTATRVPLSEAQPALRRLGPLTYLGGVHLSSRNWAFGGYSSLIVRGDRFLLLSDGGLTLDFAMGADWRPRDARVGELPDGPGTGWRKSDRDSESMVADPKTGDLLVGFERANAIWRYDAALTRVIRHYAPPAMKRWPRNGGPEAMAILKDGRTVVFAEDASMPGGRPGKQALIFPADPTDPQTRPRRFAFVPPDGYDPTDAVVLPDGRLLVLTRALTLREFFTAKLVLVDSRTIRAGATVRGREIASFTGDVIHDNFEGLAVTREGRTTVVWVLSDDNGPSLFERSLLLKFRFDG
ncbi:esterase-like activity of phytase family protein [uncultured Sphingomonas sp.]|uniref:esterase-like activity of phytase family protein n=1 Tax=uncultured Sphingomonas sp. TaxID=158754 RepID=UPI0025E604E3|nr:esterase-like activity of phytase family protein [uncultured Sphingomonas sp.]